MIKKLLNKTAGFTLVELMVAISIIGILSSIVYANFGEARKAARDDIRKTDLKNLQLAIEFYKAQNDVYPAQGCLPGAAGPGPQPSWGCTADEYIFGLVPDFIAELPKDPISEYVNGQGYLYISDGSDYKLLAHGSVEVKTITSYNDDFSRCPAALGPSCVLANNTKVYAVYSAGAADW